MNLLTIPETRVLCSTCHTKRAWLGERECGDCLMETRLAGWLQTQRSLPGNQPTPWAMSVDQALDWVSCGALHGGPRIQEVPQRDSFWERLPQEKPKPATVPYAHFRAVVSWMGLAALWMFTFGLLLGRFAR